MSTTEAPHDLDPHDPERPFDAELRLDPLVHGRGRVPGQDTATFDLAGFAAALEHHDVAYQLGRYAPDADIRVLDANRPPAAARTIRGSRAIRTWLDTPDALTVEVTHLVHGGDRIAFTERRQHRDGIDVMATSTAELRDGLITTQHTILAQTRKPLDPIDGWTQVSKGLWTKTS